MMKKETERKEKYFGHLVSCENSTRLGSEREREMTNYMYMKKMMIQIVLTTKEYHILVYSETNFLLL